MPKQPPLATLTTIPLDRKLPMPLYRQIYDGVRQMILRGQLSAGARLPSTRDLARELQIARATVQTAFEQLLAEGYLEGKVGWGPM
jgi:GntR family transcriptional regulator/MocR family aminotransferase